MATKSESNVFVSIGASLAGIFMVIVLFFLIFAREQASTLSSIAWAFAFVAVCMGYFASKKK